MSMDKRIDKRDGTHSGEQKKQFIFTSLSRTHHSEIIVEVFIIRYRMIPHLKILCYVSDGIN